MWYKFLENSNQMIYQNTSSNENNLDNINVYGHKLTIDYQNNAHHSLIHTCIKSGIIYGQHNVLCNRYFDKNRAKCIYITICLCPSLFLQLPLFRIQLFVYSEHYINKEFRITGASTKSLELNRNFGRHMMVFLSIILDML